MTKFAQTNIALFLQMRAAGYADADIELVKRAYFFAVQARILHLRGSGKPFICHLVGVASILVALKQHVDVVAAGLLHAMYLPGSNFGKERKKARSRRPVMKDAFGERVEEIVYAYHKFGWKYGETKTLLSGHNQWDDTKRAAVTIRLANELEDFLDGAILFCGSPDDDVGTEKSVAWRLDYLDKMGVELVAAASSLGHPDLAGWIEEEISLTRSTEPTPALLSGRHETYRVRPGIFAADDEAPESASA